MSAITRFQQSIGAADQLIGMYRELRTKRGLGARGRLDAANVDLLWLPRSAVVASISSFDAYIHHVLDERIPVVLQGLQPTNALAEAILENFSIKTAGEFKQNLAVLASNDSLGEVFATLRDKKLAFASYQAPDKVIGAYKLIGVDDVFGAVARMWPGPASTSADIRRALASYAKRRNQIAHEGDREADGSERSMQPEYAAKCKDFVVALVSRLDRVVYGT